MDSNVATVIYFFFYFIFNLENLENHHDPKTCKSSSGAEDLVDEKSPSGQNNCDETHVPVIKIVKQVVCLVYKLAFPRKLQK